MCGAGADGRQDGGRRNLSADGGEKPVIGGRSLNFGRRKSSERRERARVAGVLGDRTTGPVIASIDQLEAVGRADRHRERPTVDTRKVGHETGRNGRSDHERQ